MSKKHTIILNDKEQEILEKLINERGWRKQEVFRYRLRDLYKTEFPPYNQSKKKEMPRESMIHLVQEKNKNMTNEEYCVKVIGGKVEGDQCRIDRPHGWYHIPLIGVKLFSEFDYIERLRER
jgi:hypothetical protein